MRTVMISSIPMPPLLSSLTIALLALFHCAAQQTAPSSGTIADLELKREQDAIAEVLMLVSPEQQSFISGEHFATAGCKKIPYSDWVKFILANQPVTMTLTFQNQCDVDGTFTIVPNGSSSISGRLRNFRDFTRFEFTMKTKVVTDLATFSASSPAPSEFTGNYELTSAQANRAKTANSVAQNSPGTVSFTAAPAVQNTAQQRAKSWGLVGEIVLTKYHGKPIPNRSSRITGGSMSAN